MHPQYTRQDIERFWALVDKTGSCWLWLGGINRRGYARFDVIRDGRWRSLRAHRCAYEIVYGVLPGGMLVCHTCDNRACVRNDVEGFYEVNGILRPRRGHLWLGTHDDNMADMATKGRARKGKHKAPGVPAEKMRRGEGHPRARITEDQVRDLRQRRANGATLGQLAKEFGLLSGHVCQIVTRKSWRHVD